jgi:hypothetical protein
LLAAAVFVEDNPNSERLRKGLWAAETESAQRSQAKQNFMAEFRNGWPHCESLYACHYRFVF